MRQMNNCAGASRRKDVLSQQNEMIVALATKACAAARILLRPLAYRQSSRMNP